MDKKELEKTLNKMENFLLDDIEDMEW